MMSAPRGSLWKSQTMEEKSIKSSFDSAQDGSSIPPYSSELMNYILPFYIPNKLSILALIIMGRCYAKINCIISYAPNFDFILWQEGGYQFKYASNI